jgi:LacI family transcriptional regulator/LacI family repressor for deo operon, udp, cdd, tsx, nupC, and nupG
MKEVAKRAGVSVATVSRVLNNHARVDPILRQRVNEAIQALNYRPNRVAQRLRAGAGGVIGLIISDIENPFFVSVVRGVEDLAYENGLSVLLCNSDENPDKQELYIRVMMDEDVAGLIITPNMETDPALIKSLEEQMAVVFMDRLVDGLNVDSVTVDGAQGTRHAIQHLINLGHKRIGLVSVSTSISTGRERYNAFIDTLRENQLPVDPLLLRQGTFRQQSGYRLTLELLNLPNPPTAIFASNNVLSLGMLQALHERNIRIPEEIAVVGFDDMPWASSLWPPLTTVAQPTYQLGYEATRLLLRRIADRDGNRANIVLNTELVVRKSCGAG